MRLNKKIIGTILFVGLFCFTGRVLGAGDATIPNLIGASDFKQLLGKIASGVGTLIGALGTIMFIISGIMFLFSAGSPEKINNAKRALVYAIIGIVVGLTVNSLVAFIQQTVGE